MEGPTKGNNRGKSVKTHKNVEDFQKCTKFCDENSKCKSFLYDSKKKTCALKDLLLTGTEPIVKNNTIFYSVYKKCNEGMRFCHSVFSRSLKLLTKLCICCFKNAIISSI